MSPDFAFPIPVGGVSSSPHLSSFPEHSSLWHRDSAIVPPRCPEGSRLTTTGDHHQAPHAL